MTVQRERPYRHKAPCRPTLPGVRFVSSGHGSPGNHGGGPALLGENRTYPNSGLTLSATRSDTLGVIVEGNDEHRWLREWRMQHGGFNGDFLCKRHTT